MKRLCVYCGSSPGRRPAYAIQAQTLAQALATHGIGLVYGGSGIGLMGTLADAVLDAGGHVTGVIPRGLVEREVGHPGLSELHVVASMHERKLRMAELSDAFVALPGGLGTLDELFEIWTWAQLGIHQKPFGLLNVEGYFDRLLGFLDHAVEEGFVAVGQRNRLVIAQTVPQLLGDLMQASAPLVQNGAER